MHQLWNCSKRESICAEFVLFTVRDSRGGHQPLPRRLGGQRLLSPGYVHVCTGSGDLSIFSAGFAEPDIWWHLRNAAYLFQHHSFPRVDTYSFGAAGSPRLNYEWLSEIPFLLGFDAWGLQGLLAVYFAVFTLIYIGVYYRSCRGGASCLNASITTLLAILLGVVSIGPRVLLFGWLCMVGLLLVLDHFQRTGKGLWLLPPLFALWINLHGSWIFGMVVLGLTIAAGLLQGEWGLVVARRWSPQELKKLLLALAASLAALFVNPFGYKLVRYPFDFLFRQQTNMQLRRKSGTPWTLAKGVASWP